MTDSKNILTCPACGKEMKKYFLKSVKFNVDICTDGCGGIFLDNREYKKITETPEAIKEINSITQGKTYQKVDSSYKRICPVCKMKMIKNSTSIKNEIIIDECYSCGGKFLDNGELDKIQNEYSSEEERTKAMSDYLRKKMGYEFDEIQAQETLNKVQKEPKKGFLDGILKKFI